MTLSSMIPARIDDFYKSANIKINACLHQINMNDLLLSSTILLFVNNSSHSKAKGVFCKEINQDDYVGCCRCT